MSNPELLIKRQYRTWLIQALARHFNVDKKVLFESVDMDGDEIILLDPLSEFRFHHPIYVGKIPKIDLPNFYNGARFQKSRVYEEFVGGESKLTKDYDRSFIMALVITKDIFILYRANGYKGLGGTFFTTPNEGSFVIEPIKNFLNFRYPVGGDELVD